MESNRSEILRQRDLEEGWGLLEALNADGHLLRRVHTLGTETVYQGINERRQRFLAFPIAIEETVQEDRRSVGLQLTATTLEERNKESRFLTITCGRAHLVDLFSIVVADILEEIATSTLPLNMSCLRVLERWREFLSLDKQPGLTREQMVGLFGELWILRELCRRSPKAMDSWMGPSGHQHDFLGRHVALEVKSSITLQWRFPQINGIKQLAAPQAQELYLSLLRLDIPEEGGETVRTLLTELSTLINDRHQLISQLSKIGIGPHELESLSQPRYEVTEHRMYLVDSDFPKITPSGFTGGDAPTGVQDIRYRIDLSGETPPALVDSGVDMVFDRLAHGSA